MDPKILYFWAKFQIFYGKSKIFFFSEAGNFLMEICTHSSVKSKNRSRLRLIVHEIWIFALGISAARPRRALTKFKVWKPSEPCISSNKRCQTLTEGVLERKTDILLDDNFFLHFMKQNKVKKWPEHQIQAQKIAKFDPWKPQTSCLWPK